MESSYVCFSNEKLTRKTYFFIIIRLIKYILSMSYINHLLLTSLRQIHGKCRKYHHFILFESVTVLRPVVTLLRICLERRCFKSMLYMHLPGHTQWGVVIFHHLNINWTLILTPWIGFQYHSVLDFMCNMEQREYTNSVFKSI